MYDCEGPHRDHLEVAFAMSQRIKSPKSALTVVRVLRTTFITRAMLCVNDDRLAAEYALGVICNVCQDGMSPDLVDEVLGSGLMLSFASCLRQIPEAPGIDMCAALLKGASAPDQLEVAVLQLRPGIEVAAETAPLDPLCAVLGRVAATRSAGASKVVEAACGAIDARVLEMTPTASAALFAACDICKHYGYAEHVAANTTDYVGICSGRFLLDATRLIAAVADLPLPPVVPAAAITLLEHADVGERWLEIRCCLTPDALGEAVAAVGRRDRVGPGTVQAAVVCALVAADAGGVVSDEVQQEILGMVGWAADNGFQPPDEVVRLLATWAQGTVQQISSVCDLLAGCPALCAFLHPMATRDAQLLLELEVA